MARLASTDSVRAYLLFLGGKPVSYLYLPAQGGRLLYSFLGYRPDRRAALAGHGAAVARLGRDFPGAAVHAV